MKKIIILERQDEFSLTYKYALWADVPQQRQFKYANTGFNSSFSSATTGELADLRSGKMVERTAVGSWPSGTSLNTIKSELEDTWLTFQNEISGKNPWQRYGTSWDGSAWVTSGVN